MVVYIQFLCVYIYMYIYIYHSSHDAPSGTPTSCSAYEVLVAEPLGSHLVSRSVWPGVVSKSRNSKTKFGCVWKWAVPITHSILSRSFNPNFILPLNPTNPHGWSFPVEICTVVPTSHCCRPSESAFAMRRRRFGPSVREIWGSQSWLLGCSGLITMFIPMCSMHGYLPTLALKITQM